MAAMSSTAPAAPMQCPCMDLVEDTLQRIGSAAEYMAQQTPPSR